MNLLLVALVSVILATGVFNTEPKVGEGNKKTEIIVKETSEKKPTEEEIKAEAEAEAKAKAEAEAKAEAQEVSKEIDSSKETGTNYLRLALYIFGSILVISIGTYFYFRHRDNLSSRSVTRKPDSPRRDFRKEAVAEPQEEQTREEEVKPEPQEEQSSQEEVKPEPQEEQSSQEEVKPEPQEEQSTEDEKK